MKLAIRALEEQAPLTRERVDAFLGAHRFPIVEGRTVTFVYRGPAEAVFLQHWIFGLTSAQPFVRMARSDLWYLIQEIPVRSRVEYKLEVHDALGARLIRDPLNSALAHDPFGANSVCHGADYAAPTWVEPDPEARKGRIDEAEIASEVFGDRRPLAVYVPARFRATRRYPLLVVHDGFDYLRFTSLQDVLDNLIHRLEIAPMIVALTHSPARMREYAADPRHARFVADELVPWMLERYPIERHASAWGLMGASFGAVAALSTAVENPGRFGRLFVQSGSFAFSDIGPSKRGPAFDPIVEFMNRYRERPQKVAQRIFATCGVYESLIYENRSLVPILQSTGMEVRYVEAHDGHNWENWRDRLREGLSWLFPGPLWMVYE